VLVKYGPGLVNVVQDMKACLDMGYMIRAGVASGVAPNKGIDDPDHFILVLGYDDGTGSQDYTTKFIFWDSDSARSTVAGGPPPAGTPGHG
jgi:hypothetical protein